MISQRAAVGLSATVIGLILSILGMVSYTEIMHLGIPDSVMYLGYVLTIIGLIVIYIDTKEGYAEIERGESSDKHEGSEEETSGSVSDGNQKTE